MTENITNDKSLAQEIKALGPHIHPPVPNPAPLGLFAFGLTTALLQVKHTRLGGDTAEDRSGTDNFVFGFAMFFGGLLQLIAGIHEQKRNNVFGYTVFQVYGGFWMSFGASRFLAVIADAPVNPQAVQAMLCLMGIFSFVMLIMTFVMNMTISLLFFLVVCTFFLLAAGIDNVQIDMAAGWVGIVTAAVAYWLASAELFNDIVGAGNDLIPLGHWKKNKFRFAGGWHVPGRIHGVTHRQVLIESEYGPDSSHVPTLTESRKSFVTQTEPLDIEEGSSSEDKETK